jgi:hypothetical protein
MVPPAQCGQCICDRNTVDRMSDIIETLAEFIHEPWRTGDWHKEKHLDVRYARLAPGAQEDNRAAARRIPAVLALVGLGIAPREKASASSKPSIDEIAGKVEAQIELLAEAEHEGWMTQRARSAWRYGWCATTTLLRSPMATCWTGLCSRWNPLAAASRRRSGAVSPVMRNAGMALRAMVNRFPRTAASSASLSLMRAEAAAAPSPAAPP